LTTRSNATIAHAGAGVGGYVAQTAKLTQRRSDMISANQVAIGGAVVACKDLNTAVIQVGGSSVAANLTTLTNAYTLNSTLSTNGTSVYQRTLPANSPGVYVCTFTGLPNRRSTLRRPGTRSLSVTSPTTSRRREERAGAAGCMTSGGKHPSYRRAEAAQLSCLVKTEDHLAALWTAQVARVWNGDLLAVHRQGELAEPPTHNRPARRAGIVRQNDACVAHTGGSMIPEFHDTPATAHSGRSRRAIRTSAGSPVTPGA